jgi:hypothetical protein
LTYFTLSALYGASINGSEIARKAESGLQSPSIFHLPADESPRAVESEGTKLKRFAERELTSYLQVSIEDQSKIYQQAHALLASLENSPSCNRLATVHLLSSCQSLSGGQSTKSSASKNPAKKLDQLKSLYAARLAVCELVGAGIPAPVSCSTLLPPSTKGNSQVSGWLKRFNPTKWDYENQLDGKASKTTLGECLRALESRPQWWTSYSNGRQNAAVMCQAARGEIEKGELLILNIPQLTDKLH